MKFKNLVKTILHKVYNRNNPENVRGYTKILFASKHLPAFERVVSAAVVISGVLALL